METMRPTNERQTWISILEAASQRPGDEVDDQWRWLLQQLRMPAESYLALREALHQGRWRDAKNPRAYLKTVAKREALKQQIAAQKNDPLVLISTTVENVSVEESLDHLSYAGGTRDAIQGRDGVWRRGGGREQDYFEDFDEDEDGKPVSLRGRLLAKVPQNFKVLIEPSDEYKRSVEEFNAATDEWHIHPTPSIGVDMEKWAALAGFDQWEIEVLRYRLEETSREQALQDQPTEQARRALQAAWRRYDRTGKQRLKIAAEKNFQKSVPEAAQTHTR